MFLPLLVPYTMFILFYSMLLPGYLKFALDQPDLLNEPQTIPEWFQKADPHTAGKAYEEAEKATNDPYILYANQISQAVFFNVLC